MGDIVQFPPTEHSNSILLECFDDPADKLLIEPTWDNSLRVNLRLVSDDSPEDNIVILSKHDAIRMAHWVLAQTTGDDS